MFSDAECTKQKGNKIINLLSILLNEMLRHKLLKHNNDNLRDSLPKRTGHNKLLLHNNGPLLQLRFPNLQHATADQLHFDFLGGNLHFGWGVLGLWGVLLFRL